MLLSTIIIIEILNITIIIIMNIVRSNKPEQLILTITMTTGPLPQRHLSPGASKCKSESAIKVMMYLYLYLYADCDFDDTTIF